MKLRRRTANPFWRVVGIGIMVIAIVNMIAIGLYVQYLWWFVVPDYTERRMFLEYWPFTVASVFLMVAAILGEYISKRR